MVGALPEFACGFGFLGAYRHLPDQLIKPGQDICLAGAALRPLEQLCIGKERHAQHGIIIQSVDVLSHRSGFVLDHVDERVGVEQVFQNDSRSCIAGCCA